MAGLFDDLVPQSAPAPQAAAAPSAGLFDDLVPNQADIVPAGMGQPGLSSNPWAGVPTSLSEFLGNGKAPSQESGPWKGSVLPISGDGKGNWSFDPSAGIVGAITGAVTLPADVASGKTPLYVQNPDTGKADINPQAIGRSADLAAVASPVNPAIGAGDLAIPGAANALKAAKATPPTAEELRAAAGTGYDIAGSLGVHYSSPEVAAVAQSVQANLNDKGILPVLAPKTHAVLNALQNVPAGESTVPFGALDAARKAFGHAAGDFTNPTEQLAAKTAQNAVDGFVANPPPGGVVAGDAASAAQVLQQARANYAASARSDALNGIEQKAELRAAAANSGANTGNSIRQRVASLLSNPKQLAGFSPDEIDALNEVVRGSPTRNATRIVGNLLGGGGGMHGAGLGLGLGAIGEHVGGPIGAAIGVATPLIGAGFKHLDNSLTANSLRSADEMTRARSPLAEALASNSPPVLDNPGRRAALARALLEMNGSSNNSAQ